MTRAGEGPPLVTPGPGELYDAFDSDPAPIVAFLLSLVASYGLSPPLRALDVGCGTGRLLLPLARLGWEVTGMEPNPGLLASAAALARSSRRLSVRRGGFLDVEDHEAFDLVLAINSSFAHLLTPRERGDALRRIHDALRPGGVVCLDLPDFGWILRNHRPSRTHASTVEGREVTLHRRHEIDLHGATVTTTDAYVFAGDRSPSVELVHAYGVTSRAELRHHLRGAGFGSLRAFRGYGSRAAERLGGPRMILAARRPPA